MRLVCGSIRDALHVHMRCLPPTSLTAATCHCHHRRHHNHHRLPASSCISMYTCAAVHVYIQAGQFIGARADFVPDQICRKLCLLQDQVPPMSPARAKQVDGWVGDAQQTVA